VRVILTNPRYTGRQVWNKQRKDEVLLDVEDVALGHETKLRWNKHEDWVWSTDVVHEPLVDVDSFERAQAMLAAHGRGKNRTRTRVQRTYVLRGLVHCGVCERRMQGQWNHERPYCRCRYPREYGLANRVRHPSNVYVAEQDVLPVLDQWLARLFAPARIERTVQEIWEAQADEVVDPASARAGRVIEECDAKLARYRAALEAGTDPALVAGWIAQVQSERAAALGGVRPSGRQRVMTRDEIRAAVGSLDNVLAALTGASATDKAEVYRHLGLRLIYRPDERTVHTEVTVGTQPWGYGLCPRGDSNTCPWQPCRRQGFMWRTIGCSSSEGQFVRRWLVIVAAGGVVEQMVRPVPGGRDALDAGVGGVAGLRRRDPPRHLLHERDRVAPPSPTPRCTCTRALPDPAGSAECLHLVARSLDPDGKGRARWSMRGKPAL
jgi:hypothetical protein